VSKSVYQRISVSLDLGTIKRLRELAGSQGQNRSALIRFAVRRLHKDAMMEKRSASGEGLEGESGK
jgi:hypothetical protein